MAKVENPVRTIFSNAVDNNALSRASSMKAVTTGLKQDLSVVAQIIGAKVRSAANLCKEVVSGTGTGFNIENVILSTLSKLRGIIEGIKIEIGTLNNADEQTLRDAQGNYEKEIANLYQILENANFGGKKLFDGTLAIRVVAPTNQGMPTTFGPSRIQTGTNVNQYIDISMPRLLAGDGTFPEVAIPGMFEPLIPTIDGSFKDVSDGGAVVKATIAPNTIDAIGGATGVVTAIAALPLSAMRTFSVTIGIQLGLSLGLANASAVGGNIANMKTQLDNTINATAIILNTALTSLNAGTNPSTSITAAEINMARDAIKAGYAAIATTVGDVRTTARDLRIEAPTGSNSVLRAVYQSLNDVANSVGLAAHTTDNIADGVGPANNTKAAINTSIDSVTATINKITFAAGNIETPAGRLRATALLDSMITKIDSQIAQQTGTKNNLTAAKSILDALVIELDSAANNYLSANYGEEIPKLTESVRKDKIAAIGLALAERAINSILEQLNQMAISST